MSEAGRRQWWRAVAATVVAGSATAVAWFGFIRDAGAEPVAQTASAAAPATSATVPEPPALPPPADVKVIPASAELPPLPVVPVVPVAADPVAPAALPPLPTAPAVPPVKPVIPPLTPEQLPHTVTPQVPPMMGGILPIRPAEAKTPDAKPEVKPAEAKKNPASPATPPVVPAIPVIPPPAAVAPPPSPVKVPEPAQPVVPVPPVSGLPGENSGGSVKTDRPGGGTGVIPPVLPDVPPPATLVEPVKPVVPAIPAVGTPGQTTGTPVDLARPPAPLLKDPTPVPFPAIPTNTTASTPGENTMLHLNRAAALAVIGGALMAPASPATAAPVAPVPPPVSLLPTAQTGANKDEKTDVAELKKKVEEVNDKLTTIQKDLRTLTELLNGKKDEKGLPLPSDPGAVAQLKKLSDKLYDLEKELEKMKTQTSLRPANPVVTPDPKAGKGTVRIVNEYPVKISIVVNGTSYRVEPSKSLDIDVPAGEFSYQLLESGAASTKSAIKEKETVTLRIK